MAIVDSKYETGQQPCEKFCPKNEEWFGLVSHVCPKCGGFRMFCHNCHRDHHENGWEDCGKNEPDDMNPSVGSLVL